MNKRKNVIVIDIKWISCYNNKKKKITSIIILSIIERLNYSLLLKETKKKVLNCY